MKVLVNLSPWMSEAVKKISNKIGMDYNNIVRSALIDYISKYLPKEEIEEIKKDG